MKPLSDSEALAVISSLPIEIESWESGTVRFTLASPSSSRRLTNAELWDLPMSEAIVFGRESTPPLSAQALMREAAIRNTILATHRVAFTDSRDELVDCVLELQEQGWSVSSDVYVIESAGHWLMYVSHNDGFDLDEPKA